jgi:hypothetical protein
MALSAVFFGLTFDFPAQTLAFSPKIFPRFVSICLFAISLVLVIHAAAALRKAPAGKKAAPGFFTALNKAHLTRLLACILIGYAYTEALSATGYLLATPFFIAGIMIIFQEKGWLKIAATSIFTTVLLYVLFRIVFRVPLPRFNLF